MGSIVFRILVVLLPLAVWMVVRVPTDGIAVARDAMSGREVFVQNCASCHVHGVAMAPRIDTKVDWESRLPSGRQGLLNSVLKGKGGMPPKGGNASISDAQAAAGLEYMLETVAALKASSTKVAQGQ
jgi:cytochrome c5